MVRSKNILHIPKTTVTTFSSFLTRHLVTEGYEYTWSVSDACQAKLGTGFNWHSFDTPKDANKALKYHLKRHWKFADWDERLRIANWVVRDWGGIKGNKTETLEAHVKLTEPLQPKTLIKGVASYSKILAIKDPDHFAIYDARVAASLNAIQVLCASDSAGFKKVFFPYLPGRNSIIEGNKTKPGFVKIADKRRLVKDDFGFELIKRDDAYGVYLELLYGIRDNLNNVGIVDVEMVLFSEAENLCKKALEKL